MGKNSRLAESPSFGIPKPLQVIDDWRVLERETRLELATSTLARLRFKSFKSLDGRSTADSINADLGTVLDAVARRYRLSPRERELFQMALQGSDTRRIARQLGLSVGTIKNYKRRLYAKLGINCEREIVSLLMNFLADATLPSTQSQVV
jgi:DNA-binding CsgD family transcriptional regulator